MKKLISILLLITMIMTTLVIAIPASAAATEKLSDALINTGNTAARPTGNYRGKGCNNALYAAGGERANWTAISTAEQFLAITSGTAETPACYYLTADITLNANQAGKAYVTIDGNGYTVNVGGRSMFSSRCTNLTFENITITTGGKNIWRNYGMSIIAYDNSHTGTLNLKNVNINTTMSCDCKGGSQNIGGVIAGVGAGSVWDNVVVDANITLNATTKMQTVGGAVGEANAVIFKNVLTRGKILLKASTWEEDPKGIGGIVGQSKGNSTYENCINQMEISVAEGVTMTSKEAYGVGGIVGTFDNNTVNTLRNCTNDAAITSASPIKKNFGGIVGASGSWNITIENCVNNGAITVYGHHGEDPIVGVGGILGNQYKSNVPTLTIKNCANNGEIKNTQPAPSGWSNAGGMPMGGILGVVNGLTGTATIENCVNTARVNNGKASGWRRGTGGIMGVHDAKAALTIKNCINTVKSIKNIWDDGIQGNFNVGGILGNKMNNTAIATIENCVNIANVRANAGNADVGGIVAAAQGANTTTVKKCLNLDVLTTASAGRAIFWIAPTTATQTDCKSVTVENNKVSAEQLAEALAFAAEKEIIAYNKDALVTELEAAAEYLDKGHKYSEFTWNKFDTAYKNALALSETAVINCTQTASATTVTVQSQKAVNDAVAALASARKGLVAKDEVPKALALIVAEAEKFFDSDVVYTATSWASFIEALNAAKALQATDLKNADPVVVNEVIEDLNNAMGALIPGGEIYTAADFAKLNGQEGVFVLMADITVTDGIDSFEGILNGNGHTITLDGCALFGEANGAFVANLTVNGSADASVFGKAVGEVLVKAVIVDVDGEFGEAVLFSGADDNTDITVEAVAVFADKAKAVIVDADCAVTAKAVFAEVDAPALVGGDAEIEGSYLVGVEAYAEEKIADLSTGEAAFVMNYVVKNFVTNNAEILVDGFDALVFTQIIGTDAYPVIAPIAVDRTNEVIMVGNTYKNAAVKISDDSIVPVLPEEDEPIVLNFAALDAAIASANMLKAEDYTAATWVYVEAYLAIAKASFNSKTQAEVDQAAADLTAAIGALVKAPAAPSEVVIDYSKLDAAIAKAEALKESDYSSDTWAGLVASLGIAKSAKISGGQITVDGAAKALEESIAALKAPAAEQTPTDKPTEPAPVEKEGCGSVIGGAAVVLTAVLALGAGVSFKKKED